MISSNESLLQLAPCPLREGSGSSRLEELYQGADSHLLAANTIQKFLECIMFPRDLDLPFPREGSDAASMLCYILDLFVQAAKEHHTPRQSSVKRCSDLWS